MPVLSAWRRLLLPLAAASYLTMIVLGSWLSTLPKPLQDTDDKLLHVLAYGGLAGLLFVGLRLPALKRALVVVATVAVLGAVDETIQSFFPHRHSDPMDWLADISAAAGVCLVLGIVRHLYRSRTASRAPSP